ncbi:MAG: hypothetical protein WCP28_20220 [Actinomycetes bacterium]
MNPDELTSAPDSELWALLGEATGLDRVELLCELGGRAGRDGDHSQAASLFGSAGEASKEIEDASMAGYAFSQQGVALRYSSEFVESAASYQESAAQFRLAGRGSDTAEALIGQADSLRVVGDFEACLAASSDARALAESEDELELAGRAAMLQARALYWLDREVEALWACTEGRNLLRKAGSPALVAQIDDFALTVCMFLGELDRALELATSCYVIARATADSEDDAYAELRLAETHLERREPKDALQHAEHALESYVEADEMVGVARCQRVRAGALSALDRDAEAIEVLTQARVLFDANGLDVDALRCDVHRAIILHVEGRYREAETLNSRLVDAYRAMSHPGARIDHGWAVARLADNYLADDNPQAAMDVVRTWIDDWDSRDDDMRSVLINTLAAQARATEQLSGLVPAFEVAERALAITAEADINRNTAHMYDIRARHYLEIGDQRGEQELAHAIALHLATGSVGRARELSGHFMPEISERPGDKSAHPAPRSRAHT